MKGWQSAAALLLLTCVRPADQRAELDNAVGLAADESFDVLVVDNQAAVRELGAGSLLLWAQAPVLQLQMQSERDLSLRVEVRNCMPDAVLTIAGTNYPAQDKPRPTWCVYQIDLARGDNEIVIAPADWNEESAYRFADMGDIQTAMDSVHEVFETISATPDLRFVMSTGDVVETGDLEEYELFQEMLASLNIPFFSTIGNLEVTSNAVRWHELFGRYSVHFRFKGMDFSFVDSGNATIDPSLYERLDTWLAAGQDRVHIFGTHYPPLDPVGARNAGFRSRNEASKLLTKLAKGNIDLTLYGHVHSFYQFTNAEIPAYISGGGGALPERFDGVDRHFLVIEVDPSQNQVSSVDLVRVP